MGLKPVGDSLSRFIYNTKILHKSISMLLVFFSYEKYRSIIGASTRNKKVPCFGLQRILDKIWIKFWWIIYHLSRSAHNIFKISVFLGPGISGSSSNSWVWDWVKYTRLINKPPFELLVYVTYKSHQVFQKTVYRKNTWFDSRI